MLPQSTRIHPDSTSPSTPIIWIFSFLSKSTSFSDIDFACLFELAVAIIISSAKEDIPFTLSLKKLSIDILNHKH